MNYFAYNIFNFGHKAIWAPYFISTEGYGKDTFIDLIQLALGNYNRHFLKTDGYQFLNPQWTSALEHKAFVFVNEVYASVGQSGAKAEQAWHLVKDRITNETSIRISTKYQTDRNIQQPTNYAFASNTTNGLRYSKTERRLLVVHLDRHHKNENFRDAKNAVSEDFDLIYRIFDQCSILPNTIRTSPNEKREIREAVLTVFRDFSPKETWDADFNPRGHAYQTPEFLEIANYTVEPHEAAFEEVLEDPEIGFVTPQTIFYTPLRQLVQGYFESRRILHQFSDQKLKDIIRTRGYIAVVGTNVTLKHILKDQAMHYKMPVSPVYVSSSYHQLDWQLKHKDIYSYLRSLYSIYEQQLISNEFDVIPSEPQDGEFLQ